MRPFRDSFINTTFLCLVVLLLLPEIAYAQGQKNSVSEVLCTVWGWLTGPLGSAIGVLGVIALAIAAMFGRIQVGSVLTTMAGIALIFGSQAIVNQLLPSLNASCTPSTTAPDILASPLYHMFGCMVRWFDGPIGKSLASLAIIILGVFAMYGRISYHQALVVSVGIATMFGAVSVIGNLGIPMQKGTFPISAACTSGNTIENVYCSVVGWFNGPMGKALGTIGIIVLGIGALYGKISWGLGMIAVVGTALVFGGTTIVAALGGPGDLACSAGQAYNKDLAITVMLCNVVRWFNGATGKVVATLGMIVIGIGALAGKVSWPMGMLVAVGVSLIFGGTTVLSALGGPGDLGCPVGKLDGNSAVLWAPIPTLPLPFPGFPGASGGFLPSTPQVTPLPTNPLPGSIPTPSGGGIPPLPPGIGTSSGG